MRCVLVSVAILAACCAGPASSQDRGSAIKFDIPVLPELGRYVQLLTAPGYFALALENNGLHPSVSSRLIVNDRESVQVRAGVVRYKGNKDGVYLYEAGVNVTLGLADKEFTIPVEVDTSAISRSMVTIRAYPPLAALVRAESIERGQAKIDLILNIPAQRKVLAYLDRLSKEQQSNGRGFDGMLEAILLEAYNKSPGPGRARDRGEPEPLSDQILLLATVAIWLIGFPIFLLFVRIRRKREGSAPP